MRELAVITKIQHLNPIDGKDRIEVATVENYEVIVEKGKYAIGDLVIYIFYETVLPVKPEFEFLRSRCYNSSYNGFRIRPMKMGNVISQGIVFPMDILPRDKSMSMKPGTDVSDILGVRKYEPETFLENAPPTKKTFLYKHLKRFKWYRNLISNKPKDTTYPITVAKSDEVNIQKIFDSMKSLDTYWYISEKVEGCAATFLLRPKSFGYKFQVFSHNTIRDPKDNGCWSITARNLGIEKILRQALRDYGPLAIQGEIIGQGIQKNIYQRTTYEFYVYKITNVRTGKVFSAERMVGFCNSYGLKTVPFIARNYKWDFDTVNDILMFSNANSCLTKVPIQKQVPREGVVFTNGEKSFKVKSSEYALWFDGK